VAAARIFFGVFNVTQSPLRHYLLTALGG